MMYGDPVLGCDSPLRLKLASSGDYAATERVDSRSTESRGAPSERPNSQIIMFGNKRQC